MSAKQYSEIKDRDIRRALVELQPLDGPPSNEVARKSPDFLVYNNKFFICFREDTRDWREIQLA